MAKFKKRLDKFVTRNSQLTKSRMAAAGLEMESEAKKAAPVDTNRLRSSIHYTPTDFGYGAQISAPVEYAKYQNDGTSRIKGRRFMQKGQNAGRVKFVKMMLR